MKKGLFRFCFSVLIVLASVVVVDVTVGKVMDWMLPQISNQGSTGKTYFSLYEVNTPILIVGSSRASHHYVTEMIEDYFGKPAYNIGRNGCYFSYNCGVINSLIERYSPEIIIWENDTDYLFEDAEDPLESLYPYYSHLEFVKQIIDENMTVMESLCVKSRLYQYNSLISRIITRFVKRDAKGKDVLKGFEPMPNKSSIHLTEGVKNVSDNVLSMQKIDRFKSIIRRVKEKGIFLAIVDSPKYNKYMGVNASKEAMISICNEYDIPIFDNSQLKDIANQPELFYDRMHLNEKGAKKYTELFIEQLITRYSF